jgi:hypothetical protein
MVRPSLISEKSSSRKKHLVVWLSGEKAAGVDLDILHSCALRCRSRHSNTEEEETITPAALAVSFRQAHTLT